MSGTAAERPRAPDRRLPIEAYAAIGDGRTAALVGLDGTIDWLCLPAYDSPPVFAALLDARRGGRFALAPDEPSRSERRYVDGTCMLETDFASAGGRVRVTDAMALAAGDGAQPPGVVVRRAEGLAGRVRMRWSVEPRFGDGADPPARTEGPVVRGADGRTVAVGAWVRGEACAGTGALGGAVELEAGDELLLALAHGAGAPTAEEAARAIPAAAAGWRDRSRRWRYDGPWRDAVLRSALTLRLLTDTSTGAVCAAATTSLPETPGGERNWDYRFCWLRDASFVVDAFVRLGDVAGAEAFADWLEDVTAHADGDGDDDSDLRPFYRLDGGDAPDETYPSLPGWGGAQPVRYGNRARDQRQNGAYGDLLQSAALLAGRTGRLPPRFARHAARMADRAARAWRLPDAGIWERRPYRRHTWSRIACWVALDRARMLADAGRIPGDHADAWAREAARIREAVERECWSYERDAYVAAAGGDDLDAAVLLSVFMDYEPGDARRPHATIDRLGEELGAGELLYRTSDLRGGEGTFLPCAFWRVQALSRLGRLDEAAGHMDALVARANDVGLYAEEMTESGAMLGNIPQALTHGALVNAAVTFARAAAGDDPRGAYAT